MQMTPERPISVLDWAHERRIARWGSAASGDDLGGVIGRSEVRVIEARF